jgi:hypothetical protein
LASPPVAAPTPSKSPAGMRKAGAATKGALAAALAGSMQTCVCARSFLWAALPGPAEKSGVSRASSLKMDPKTPSAWEPPAAESFGRHPV